MSTRVDVISSCMVGLSTTEIFPVSKIELAPWDLPFLHKLPIQQGILFHKPEYKEFEKDVIDHLKISLSRTLDFFPPFAGRLGTISNTDNNVCFFIDCNNAGAEFKHATAHDVSVSDILEPNYIPEIMSSFFTLNEMSNFQGVSKPLLGVQVTELVDGFFIGLTANHVVVDGTSFWHFFNSWSEISRGCDTISKQPVFQRWFPDNNRFFHIPPFDQINRPNKPNSPTPLLKRFFQFSRESVAKLKAKANSEAGTDQKVVSSLQALLAHLWRSTNCARQQSNLDDNEITLLFIPVDTRSRIPLSGEYFGNAIHPLGCTSTTVHELLQHGIGWAAMKINEFVARQTREVAIKFVQDWVKNPNFWGSTKLTNNMLLMTNSPRYDVYGNDFGWGKPIAVRSSMEGTFYGKITTFPGEEPGGIDVEVSLDQHTMHDMEEDVEFMELVSH